MDRIKELIAQFPAEPLVRTLDATLDDLRDGLATVSATARDELLVVSGIVQGGVTAAIADFAGVYAAMTKVPAGLTPLVKIDMDFSHPIRRGDRFRATARVISEGRGSIRTEVFVMAGTLHVATARLVFAKPKP